MAILAPAPAPEPERKGYLTPQDHADLEQSIDLVKGVIERHSMEISLYTIATFDVAIAEIRNSERRMKGGW